MTSRRNSQREESIAANDVAKCTERLESATRFLEAYFLGRELDHETKNAVQTLALKPIYDIIDFLNESEGYSFEEYTEHKTAVDFYIRSEVWAHNSPAPHEPDCIVSPYLLFKAYVGVKDQHLKDEIKRHNQTAIDFAQEYYHGQG